MIQRHTAEDHWSNKDIIDLDKIDDRSPAGLASKMVRHFTKRVFDERITTDDDLNKEIKRILRKI